MSRSPSRTIARRAAATAALALAATLAAAAPWPWRFGYSPGAAVGVHGTVTDSSGRPLAGLEVALEASNPHFDWRTLTEVPGELVRHSVRSGAGGAFALDWSWDPRMRRFEVVVSLDETLGSRTLHAELTRIDVTDRLAHGTPVAAALVVEDAQRWRRLRAFLAGVRSEDEKRIWRSRACRVGGHHAGPVVNRGRLVVLRGRPRRALPRRPPGRGRELPAGRRAPEGRAVTTHRMVVAAGRARRAGRPHPRPDRAQAAGDRGALRRVAGLRRPLHHETGEYVLSGGGKRMRPALLPALRPAARLRLREEVTYAAVVEFIHTATLVHDDIIDHADLRRGQRTVHSIWGTNRTVLFGDWLYTTAMQRALAHGNLRVLDLLCDATLRMTEGELLVLQRLGDPGLGEAEYFDIIERKTARLFAAACSVPALMAPAREEACAALGRFGRSLGLCFQLVDDLLDYTASESELGKPVLSDLREGKLTLPLLRALRGCLRRAGPRRRGARGPRLPAHGPRGDPRAGPARGYPRGATELAQRHADDALSALSVFPTETRGGGWS